MKWYGYKNGMMRATNLLLCWAGCFLTGTGLLLYFRLPPASRGGRGLELYGLDRHEWGELHFYMSLLAITLTMLHLWLNWPWLCKIASSKKSWRLVAGFGLGAVIIGFFLFSPVELRTTAGH